MSEDIARLPKWAQAKIAALQRDLARVRDELDDTRNSHPGSNVRIDGGCIMPDTTLPPDSQVDFYLSREPHKVEKWEVIQVRIRDGRLLVMGYGIQGLIIRPRSNNSVEVSLNDD